MGKVKTYRCFVGDGDSVDVNAVDAKSAATRYAMEHCGEYLLSRGDASVLVDVVTPKRKDRRYRVTGETHEEFTAEREKP